MSAIVFLILAVAISCLGSAVAVMRSRHRSPASLDSGIDDFRREMQALAPRPHEGRREVWDT